MFPELNLRLSMISTNFRNLLMNPIKNAQELNKRLDFIDFVIDPKQSELVEELQNNMRYLACDLNVSMQRTIMFCSFKKKS